MLYNDILCNFIDKIVISRKRDRLKYLIARNFYEKLSNELTKSIDIYQHDKIKEIFDDNGIKTLFANFYNKKIYEERHVMFFQHSQPCLDMKIDIGIRCIVESEGHSLLVIDDATGVFTPDREGKKKYYYLSC